mgnify:CR=1 FL=1
MGQFRQNGDFVIDAIFFLPAAALAETAAYEDIESFIAAGVTMSRSISETTRSSDSPVRGHMPMA